MAHHALFAVGTYDTILPRIRQEFIPEDSEVLSQTTETLLIDDVRNIFEQTQTCIPEGRRRIFVLAFAQATVEAQNALLKLTEEPGERTQFIFIIPSESILLPTLLSRLEHLVHDETKLPSTLAEDFLKSSFAQRLKILVPYIENRNLHLPIALLHALEERLCKDIQSNRQSLKILQRTLEFLLRRGVSLKLVLEYLALSIPQQT